MNANIKQITLRLFCDNDIALMEHWLQMPHVAKWYKYPGHWLRELRERHGEFSFLTHFIVEYEGKPIGFCQYYDTYFAKVHEFWSEESLVTNKKDKTYSIDYLIGEPEYLRRGFGKQMIARLIEKIFCLDAEKIIVEPEKENAASNAALEANGFKKCGEVYVLKLMKSLVKNIDKIHTTKLGAERIKRNLDLQAGDVVLWCKDAIKNADMMWGQGKNWYVYCGGNVITVNASSFTVITARKIKAKIRIMNESDYVCLPEFLYQAIFVPKGRKPPERGIVFKKEIYAYIDDFGKRTGDLGVVAEIDSQVSAAWMRIIPLGPSNACACNGGDGTSGTVRQEGKGFGYINNKTPELAISLFPEFRGLGIGTKLMKRLFGLLKENGYKQTSLSVQKDNPAVRFYVRLGYKIIAEKPDGTGHEDYLMIKDLTW